MKFQKISLPLLKLPKPIKDALSKRELFVNSLLLRPESLSQLLPYDGVIEEENIFQLKDGSLGAVFEVKLLEHESLTENQILKAVSSTKGWFSLPENCVLQILYEQFHYSHFDQRIKDIEKSCPTPHPVSQVLFTEKMKVLKKAMNDKALNKKVMQIKKSCQGGETLQEQAILQHDSIAPLKRRTLLSVRYFPENGTNIQAKDYFHRGEGLLHKEMRHFVYELKTFQHILKNLQSNSEVQIKPLGGIELLDELRRFFNPKSYYKREFVPYNQNRSLSDQFLLIPQDLITQEWSERE